MAVLRSPRWQTRAAGVQVLDALDAAELAVTVAELPPLQVAGFRLMHDVLRHIISPTPLASAAAIAAANQLFLALGSLAAFAPQALAASAFAREGALLQLLAVPRAAFYLTAEFELNLNFIMYFEFEVIKKVICTPNKFINSVNSVQIKHFLGLGSLLGLLQHDLH